MDYTEREDQIITDIIESGGSMGDCENRLPGRSRNSVASRMARLGLSSRNRSFGNYTALTEDRADLVWEMILNRYPNAHIVKVLGTSARTCITIRAKIGEIDMSEPPPGPPLDCEEHGPRIWLKYPEGWRPLCEECKSKTGRKRGCQSSIIAAGERSGYRRMDETQVSACYNGKRYEDDPRACRRESILRWQTSQVYVPQRV